MTTFLIFLTTLILFIIVIVVKGVVIIRQSETMVIERLGQYKKTPTGKAIRACIVYIADYLKCSMVEGPDAPCMKKWNKIEEKRRKKTKDSISLD